MKVTIKVKKEVEVKTLQVAAEVRYWEDSSVNGEQDTEDGENIPCKVGSLWRPLIDIDNGIILNWTPGVTANIHYKVCDCGVYTLLDENGDFVAEKDGYVPDIMSPKEAGYGDYIIMDIDENGNIAKWKADISDIIDDEDEY
jgi:hypothetical protein